MQVNQNVSLKTFIVIDVILVIGLFIGMGYLVDRYASTRDYVKVNAKIEKLGYERVHASNGKLMDFHYQLIRFSYNDEVYHVKKRVLMHLTEQEGDGIVIYVNPRDPLKIRDMYSIHLVMMWDIFGLFMFIGMICLTVKRFRIEKEVQAVD